MSITDVVETDHHVAEIVPSMEDSSARVIEDRPQEEGSDEKQQSQSWISTNKPTLLSQGIATEATCSLEASEDYALHYLTRSVVKMMDNIGFSTCHESVLNILTDVCRRYMEKLWVDSKLFAEHAGRRFPIFEDANMVFGKLMFSAAELHSFMKQVQCDPFENNVPLFPVRKSSLNLLSMYGPVSDKELAERPEHIPRYFPAMHREWCSSHMGVRAVEVSAVKGATRRSAQNCRSTSRGRVAKAKISFPDFSGSTAKELGFVRPQKLPSKKVVEEPSGISSSANIAALQKLDSCSNRTKSRNWSLHEPTSSSDHCDEHHVKAESVKEKDVPDKPFAQRSIGMFGMPPSTLVHPESVVNEKTKKKKKRDRDRDKDRTKEKKVKLRDKEKEENPSTSRSIPVSIKSHVNEKASASANCSIDAENDGQAKKSGNKRPDVPLSLQKRPSSSEHRQIERDEIDLKYVANEKPIIDLYFSDTLPESDEKGVTVCEKVDNNDKLKHDQPVNIGINNGHTPSGVDLQMTEVLIPQQFANRTGNVEDDDTNGDSKAIEKVKEEGLKDEAKKNDKRGTSKNTLDEIAKGKIEKCKVEEKDSEWKKVTKKTAIENSLSVIFGGMAKSSAADNTPLSQDLKALKVVLSRTTGQKLFTALSPSSDTGRVAKDAEQKYGPGKVAVDKSLIAESICEKKKKHRKEKDRDKHHNKEHKRKDKKKCKEHKKDRTKDKEKKYIKLRPERLCLKRPGEQILPDEMPAPKIPKLKIRFGFNSSGITGSPTSIVSATSPTLLTSALSSTQLSERNIPSLDDQNIQVMHPAIKLEGAEATSLYTSLRPDGNIRPRKRQPVTKAELKALPKLPLKTRTCGTKEGSGFTGGQGTAEIAASSIISREDVGFEQRNYVQQPTGKRLRIDDSCFDTYGAGAFSSAEKVCKSTEKERNSESCIQGMTPKGWGQLPSATTFSTFLMDDRRQEKESLKKELEEVLKKKPDQMYLEEILKKKPDQVHTGAELDSAKPRLGKEKDPLKRVCDGDLLLEKEKMFVKDRCSGKLKNKEPEKEKKSERHYNLEKVKENGREKGQCHVQKALEKGREQGKRDEKVLGMVDDEKKEAQQDRQKEKGNDGEKKKGSGENDKGKVKKIGMVGAKLGDVSCRIITSEKKHREKLGKASGSVERCKRKSIDKDEGRGKGDEKDVKKYMEGWGCSTETKERGKHRNERTVVEERLKSRDQEVKDKEKRKKHLTNRGREYSIGKISKGIEKVSSGENDNFDILRNVETSSFSNVKTKDSGKDELMGDSNDSDLPFDPLQKTERVLAKEQLSKWCSADSDIFGSRSSTADSLTKSSDKKSITLDSDDSLDNMWICPECSVAYVEGATDMVGCDACDNWFHWSCVGLLVAPPDDAPCSWRSVNLKAVLAVIHLTLLGTGSGESGYY
uniref:BMA-TAF-3, isoform j n=3 Tax=Brugia malayi TaxID=6279 RepID=A0A1P6BT98_BRUMA|nr:BMA-TAF-3, isoform j [Brugia malayi]